MVTTSTYIVLGVLVVFIIAMISGKFPFGLISIAAVLLLGILGVIDPLTALSGFGNKNVFLMAGMFVIAYAFGKTSVIDWIQTKLLSNTGAKGDIAIVATILVITVLIAQFVPSQVSIIMIMMAFLTTLGNSGNVTISRMMMPVAFLATAWMARLPISGAGVSGYIMYNGMIEAAGGTEMLGVFSTIKATWFPAVCCLLYCIFAYKLLPAKEVSMEGMKSRGSNQERPKLSTRDNVIIYVCFVGTVVGMILGSKLGNIMYVIPAIAVVVMMFTGVLKQREVLNCIAVDPIFMAAGIFVLSDAMTSSGAGALIGQAVTAILGGTPSPLLVLFVCAIAVTLLTSFCSNMASIMVMVPICIQVCVTCGYDPRAVCLCASFCGICSMLTPMSSNGAALVYATCGFSIKDTIKWCLPLTIIAMVTCVFSCYLAFPMV